MKVFSSSFTENIKSPVPALNTAALITRVDGLQIGFTDSDQSLIIDGVEYSAEFGIQPTKLAGSADLNVDNTEISSVYSLESDRVNSQDIKNRLYDLAVLQIFTYNPDDPPSTLAEDPPNYNLIFDGYVGQISRSDRQWSFTASSKSYKLSQKAGEVTSQLCRYTLGDARCTVNLTSFTNSHTVSAIVTGTRTRFTANNVQSDGYYSGGLIVWLTGANAGFKTEPSGYTSGQFFLYEKTPNAIAIGDTFTAIRGCNKDTDCKQVFDNMVNYQGFPDVRGEIFYAIGKG